jgi:hypothetical protein
MTGPQTIRRRLAPEIEAHAVPYNGSGSVAAMRQIIRQHDPAAQVSEVRSLGVVVVAWTPEYPAPAGYVHYLIVERGCWLVISEFSVQAISAAGIAADWEAG